MNLNEYIHQRTGNFPKRGATGKEGDWLPVGELTISTGSLCAVDPMMFNADDGVVVKVTPGSYVVEGKPMDFDGHLRVCRIRIYREDTNPVLGHQVGEVGTDTAQMALCDIDEAYEDFDDAFADDLSDKLLDIAIDGGDIVTLFVGGKTITLAVCESGLGDGGYPVFELRDGQKLVGLEVEFLPTGYKHR